jgi:hypothetical protein
LNGTALVGESGTDES